jgi:hypothetical protein
MGEDDCITHSQQRILDQLAGLFPYSHPVVLHTDASEEQTPL